ncbi:MAG: hypothetical protein WBD36_11940 [Bacteroidota bacterium]
MNNRPQIGVLWNIQLPPFVPSIASWSLFSYIGSKIMLGFPVKRVAAVLILFHLVVVAGSQWGHDHVLTAVFHSLHKIQTHDCGSSERHKPLELNHQCLPCLRNSNSSGYVEKEFNVSFGIVTTLSPDFDQAQRSAEFGPSSTERGPPISA